MKKYGCLILLMLCLILGFNNIIVHADTKANTKVIYIGDSRTVGMQKAIENSGAVCIAKVSEGYKYLNSTCLSEMKKVINSNKDVTNWVIVSGFGVNDIANANKYVSFYKSLPEKLPKNKNYMVCVTPVFHVDSTKYKGGVTTDKIDEFNKKLKGLNNALSTSAVKNVRYLDDLGTSDAQKEILKLLGQDGLHYTAKNSETLFKRISASVSKCVASNSGFKVGMTIVKDSGDSTDTDSSITEDSKFISELATFLGHKPSDDEKYQYSLIITTCQADGMTNYAIAGILGNMAHESGGNIYAIEGYGGKETVDGKNYTKFKEGNKYDYGAVKPSLYTNKAGKKMGGEGHGLVQWSFGRADNLSKFAESNKDKFNYITVTHWHKSYDSDMQKHTCNIPNRAGQAAFMIQELNSDYKDVKTDMNEATSAKGASDIFLTRYEKPSGADSLKTARGTSATSALLVVEVCTGITGSSSSTSTDAQGIANSLVESGVWDQTQFLKFSELVEIDLTFPTRDNLDENQLKGIVDWRNNIEYEDDDFLIRTLRVAVMFLGIVFLVWVVLIYLSFWFDRINNILDIEFLPIVTGNRLRVSPEEESCTFNPKEFVKGQAQTVNHKAVVGICIIGIFFAVLVITGKLYTILNLLVRKIIAFLGAF